MEQATTSHTRIYSLLDQAYASRMHDVEFSIELANEAIDVCKDIGQKHLLGKSLSRLSLFHMIQGNFDFSIDVANQAITYLDEYEDEIGIADAKYAIAGALYKTDNYNLGLDYLIECLKVYKKHKDFHNQARVQKAMGTIYEYFGDTKSAIQSYEEAIESGKKVADKNLQSNAFNPLAGIYLNQGRIKEAFDLIEKSIAWKKETGDIRGLGFAYYGRGKIFLDTEDFDLAEQDFLESIRIHDETGEKLGKGMTFHKLGALYIQMGRLDDAKKILIQALGYSSKNRIIFIKFKASLLLYEVAKKEGDYELAIKYLLNYIEEKESVINDKTAKVIESYEVITKMQSLESEAKAQKEKAEIIENKNIELDSFFYRISHDLKGPITAMMSLNYLAQDDVKEEVARKYISEFAEQADRMNNILDSLMQLTKLAYSSEAKKEIDLEKLTYDCINSYKHLPNFDKVEFKIDIQSDIYYEAEWALVNTIIQNLIENSIKYARIEDNHPIIDISILEIDDEIEIKVSDNGIGMSEETQSKIFKMFFRVNRKIQGTGLGLHILNRAVDKLKGRISINSELGIGSHFKVTLPRN